MDFRLLVQGALTLILSDDGFDLELLLTPLRFPFRLNRWLRGVVGLAGNLGAGGGDLCESTVNFVEGMFGMTLGDNDDLRIMRFTCFLLSVVAVADAVADAPVLVDVDVLLVDVIVMGCIIVKVLGRIVWIFGLLC